ncbi:thiamine ABC transporter ATP-binding protein [Mesorhizobium xinjiangense]|uniref:thiamine ABC transporter ATP-binding protein n=1 Tax=Mesorhizobium xinjiangense TaxID=2678685 RepID=UPI0022A750F9|nr:thiamine ABC transporter ATP-binding protein [Mesorhizobium xinjiangense]
MSGAEIFDITIDKVRFSYDGAPMHFDATIAANAITALIGPSGSGKSTLLNLIAGFETPSQGRILFAGRDHTAVAPAERPVSMVFQENNLFAHLDVAANVGLGRSPSLKLDEADRDDISTALERVGLAGKDKRLPRELSGGERQRVALARVLVRNRPVLLLDEAFASLGPSLRRDMLDLVGELQRSRAMTVLMVTHDPADALRIAAHTIFLENGCVVASGDTATMLSGKAPAQVQRYLGGKVRDAGDTIARKET